MVAYIKFHMFSLWELDGQLWYLSDGWLFPQSWYEAKVHHNTEITEYVVFNMICKTEVSFAVI